MRAFIALILTFFITSAFSAKLSIFSPALLVWTPLPLQGTYTLATGSNFTVLTPNGNPPIQSDLSSHRYHHHTRIAVQGSRVWVAFSSSGTNEDAGGQMTVVSSSTDGGSTWSAPVAAVPSQSAFSGTGASYVAGSLISYPRAFVTYNGNLYLVGAVDTVNAANDLIGAALLAVQCNTDGTIGPLFRISKEAYAGVNYDAVLGPALFGNANVFGTWGGSTPNNAQVSWTGWYSDGTDTWVEPCTVNISSDGLTLSRFWRKNTNTTAKLWYQFSNNSGATWSLPIQTTNAPNEPSAPACLALADGRIALLGNPIDNGTIRDPLYIALFPTSGNVSSLWAVRQGLTDMPTYPGSGKSGGAAYPGIAQSGDNLWISYSMQKETIGVTKLSASSL